MKHIGIDVSKLTFDSAYLNNARYKNKQFTNNPTGFLLFMEHIKPLGNDVFICLEATGIYSFSLATFLVKQGIKTMVVNPIITHAFYKMEMNRNKTDKTDAQLIARYCHYVVSKGNVEQALYRPKDAAYEAVQRLTTRCEQLEKSKTQEKNRLEASLNTDTSKSITRTIAFIDNEMKRIKTKLTKIVNSNAQLSNQVHLLTSINGIGDKTAWSILAYIGDIAFFNNAKQVASYAGLTPKLKQSGTSINYSSLSKLGHKRLRKSLYMPALVAIRYNPILKQFYERLLNKGKPKKVALIAVMRKLLILCYGVLKSEKMFDPNRGLAN